ncbi:MAG: terpene cyclase/mutase family protein [Ruminococcus sp.]|nr:terpene cyclase/mutase family protein [Ruminococcus sp.]
MLNKSSKLNKLILLFATVTALLLSPINAFAEHKDYSNADIEKTMQGIIDWKKNDLDIDKSDDIFSADFTVTAGSPSTDWYALAVGRLDSSDNNYAYLSMLENYVVEKYKTATMLDDTKATEWHRISLVMLSLGGDPTQVGDDKINLISDGTYNRELFSPLDSQGINGLVWALITLNSMDYKTPDNACTTKDEIVDSILSKQNRDGSFSLIDNTPDIDITAMTLTALSPYHKSDNMKTKACINRAVDYLSAHQNKSGGFADENGSEAISQTIIALCSLGIDPVNDTRFIKDNHDLLDALMSYKTSDGGFKHQLDDSKSSSISGEQALLALTSINRFQNGMSSLYDFKTDTKTKAVNHIIFNENDVKRYKALHEKLTTKDYTEVMYLYNKLSDAENKNDYPEILKSLKDKKVEIEAVRKKIESINAKILNNLYPFDDITSDDADMVESIYKDVKTLDKYDQKQILGYEDLLKARTKIHTNQRSMIIETIAVGVFAMLIVLIIIRLKKRRQAKKENQMPADDNIDW